MSAEELWAIYCAKNPQFADDDARFSMTGRGLKKLFRQTWDEAHRQGVANGRALAALDAKKNPVDSFFEGLMKSRRP